MSAGPESSGGTAGTVVRDAFHIGGEWVAPASEGVITSISATTEREIGRSPEGSPADVDAAVAAARAARADLDGWAGATPAERADALEALAAAVEKRAEDLGGLIAAEVGTPVGFAGLVNGTMAGGTLRYYAGLARNLRFEEVRAAQIGRTLVRREPVGVVAAIVPWNYPVILLANKIGAALAAGCTVVVKPSPETALNSYLVADAVEEAGLPPGVVNLVPAGREVGAYLVEHPGVDKVAFTGSTAAGRQIAARCGELLRPCTLELGGKSAAVLLDDVDLPTFLAGMGLACAPNNGQTCYACTRILVPRHRYAEVLDAVTDQVRGWKVGDPLDPTTEVGPLVSARQRDRVEGYIRSGVAEGARITTGGGRPSGQSSGWFVEPTVFADVDPSMRIYREEIFGPVLTLTPYDGGDEGAIVAANDSNYGLGGTVWTADLEHGAEVARRIESGTVGVNFYVVDANAPYGGYKDSGLGREWGPEGIDPYLQYKSVYLPA